MKLCELKSKNKLYTYLRNIRFILICQNHSKLLPCLLMKDRMCCLISVTLLDERSTKLSLLTGVLFILKDLFKLLASAFIDVASSGISGTYKLCLRSKWALERGTLQSGQRLFIRLIRLMNSLGTNSRRSSLASCVKLETEKPSLCLLHSHLKLFSVQKKLPLW